MYSEHFLSYYRRFLLEFKKFHTPILAKNLFRGKVKNEYRLFYCELYMALFTKTSLGRDHRDPHEEEMEGGTILFDKHTVEGFQEEPMIAKVEEHELPVDVYTLPDKIIIAAEVAGVEEGSISLRTKDDMGKDAVLLINGIKKNPLESDYEQYLHTRECAWGKFSRPIILPQSAQLKKITAKITKDKVLIVTVPKLDSDLERVIKVEIE